MIRSVVAANPRTIVVVMGGSATVIETWRHLVPAIVLLWYPGVEGGHALADIVLGRVSPSGHLPFSIPVDESHLPHWDPDATTETYDGWHGHWLLTRDGHPPAYPFGFGLSYTTFQLGQFEVDPASDVARVAVANIGDRDAAAVVQIYGGVQESAFERPRRRLIGFGRVQVAAGDDVLTEIDLDMSQLSIRVDDSWLREGGTYQFTAAQFAGDPDALDVQIEFAEHRDGSH